MQFGEFLGNERLKDRLSAAFSKGAVSHCYLISGPAGSGKKTLARILGAALQCESANPPCMSCPACRKALNGQHPDIITVFDPDHRYIPVDMIRAMSADASIRPNEGRRKVYLIGQQMQPPAQNALLKIIEEPPPYGAFILLSDNADMLLPTVRSRCVELALSPLSNETLRSALRARNPEAQGHEIDYAVSMSDGYLGRALEQLQDASLPEATVRFLEAFAERSDLELLRLTTSLEKRKREELQSELDRWQQLIVSALRDPSAAAPSGRRLTEARTQAELLQAVEALRLALDYLEANVSAAMVCAMLSVKLR